MPEIEFYVKDSAVKGISFKVVNGKRLMVVEFQYAKNFWKDLTWAPTYQEISFIFSHIDLAERYNFEIKEIEKPEEGELTASGLYSILHRERIQSVSSFSSLPESFYSRVKKIIRRLREEARHDSDKMREYEYVEHLYKDIASCRIRKIAYLASTRWGPKDVVKYMTEEEKVLYYKLKSALNDFYALIEP